MFMNVIIYILKKVRRKRSLIHCLKCCAKVATFAFWASVCLATMKMTLFKGSPKPVVRDWMTPDNYTKWLLHGPVIGGDYPEVDYEFDTDIEKYYAVSEELANRTLRVTQMCQKYGLTNQTVNSKEFFIDYKHNFVWCNIFKAASSSWLFKLNILGGYEKAFLAKSRRIPLVLARTKFPRPNATAVLEAVKNSLSLMIVREPFVRLLSAYRDKLERQTPFYKNLGKFIVKKYRQKTNKLFGPIIRIGPTFYEFVSYLIDNKSKLEHFDEHWSPYYKFCTPCAVNFSVIAKVETLNRDNAYVIKTLGLEDMIGPEVTATDRRTRLRKITNKSKDGRNTTSLLKFYFKHLDEQMLDDLLEIYGIDFEMFGYDSNVYRNYVKKKLFE